MFKKITAILTLIACHAEALPLLSESAGMRFGSKLVLHPDHQTANKYYFFPDRGSFARDSKNVPLFSMVHWGIEKPGAEVGGYMTFSFKPSLSTDVEQEIQRFLTENPQAQVSVMPVIRSKLEVQQDNQPLFGLFSSIMVGSAAGRAGDYVGFNAMLTPAGARTMRALLKNTVGAQILAVNYCYSVQGLGPNMDAVVKVNMRRVYEAFAASSSGSFLWFSWKIRTIIEKLHTNHDISIEMNGGDANQWEYINKIAEQVTARLFEAKLPAGFSVGEADHNVPFRFTGGYARKEEYGEEKWVWKRRDLVERNYCVAMPVEDLAPYQNIIVRSAD